MHWVPTPLIHPEFIFTCNILISKSSWLVAGGTCNGVKGTVGLLAGGTGPSSPAGLLAAMLYQTNTKVYGKVQVYFNPQSLSFKYGEWCSKESKYIFTMVNIDVHLNFL